MNKMRNLISALLGLLVLAVLAVGLAWLLGPQGVLPAQQTSPVPTPIPTVPTPLPTLTPHIPETPPPVPTPVPTPVVTPIPVAKPPFIPGLEDAIPQPFHIILREGNEVWMVNSDGSDRRLLIDTESKAGLYLGHHPMQGISVPPVGWGSVSPDGTMLALVVTDLWEVEYKGQPFGWQIYLFDIQTGEFRFLVEGAEPVWSPDSGQIACMRENRLWVVDATTGKGREVFPFEEGYWVGDNMVWSPVGKKIAFVKREAGLGGMAEVLAVNADGLGEAIQLIPLTAYGLGGLSWSPDGENISYVSFAGESTGPLEPPNLWVTTRDGAKRIQLTKDFLVAGVPRWSPDGRWIVFSGTQHYEEPISPYCLWLISADGSELRRLTRDSASVLHPGWSPDGAKIIFQRAEEGVWTIDLGDGSSREVHPAPADFAVTR